MWLVTAVFTTVLSVVFRSPFEATRYVAPLAMACVVAGMMAQLRILGGLLLGKRTANSRRSIGLVLCAWLTLGVVASGDIAAWLGLGEWFGGIRTGSLGLTCFGLLMSAALSREHISALHKADALNTELKDQVLRLASEKATIRSLNEELRYQVQIRFERLADAISRLVGTEGSSTPLDEGDEVDDRYRIRRAIGKGAMGTVYEVERTSSAEKFALKVLAGVPTVTELARFAREAKLAAQITHRNVVRVFDAGVAKQGFFFIVFEYVDGDSLAGHRSRFGDASWALHVLRGLALGLAAIHESGIVHRDLKPGNILVTHDARGIPEIKITDFGISNGNAAAVQTPVQGAEDATKDLPAGMLGIRHDSVAAQARRSRGLPSSDFSGSSGSPKHDPTPLTRTGMILGTPVYMAPEALRDSSQPLTSSDIYSLGIIAFELLAGTRPFSETDSVARACGLWVGAQPSFDSFGLPAAVGAVLSRTLAIVPSARPSASEVAKAIETLFDGEVQVVLPHAARM